MPCQNRRPILGTLTRRNNTSELAELRSGAMIPTLFLGISLCSYRLWKLLAKDVVFDKPRKWFFKRFPPDAATAKLASRPRVRYLGIFVACPWCSGYWISGGTVLAVSQYVSMPLPVLWWFATSSAVGLIARFAD